MVMMSGSARRLRVRKVCEGSLGFRRRRPHPLECAVDGGPSDAEEFSKFGLGVGTEVVQLEQMLGLVRLQLRLLTAQPTVGFSDLHPLPGPHPDQVGFELSDHREHIEQQPAHRIGGIVNRAAEAELDVPLGQLVEDVAGIEQRPGEPV